MVLLHAWGSPIPGTNEIGPQQRAPGMLAVVVLRPCMRMIAPSTFCTRWVYIGAGMPKQRAGLLRAASSIHFPNSPDGLRYISTLRYAVYSSI